MVPGNSKASKKDFGNVVFIIIAQYVIVSKKRTMTRNNVVNKQWWF